MSSYIRIISKKFSLTYLYGEMSLDLFARIGNVMVMDKISEYMNFR